MYTRPAILTRDCLVEIDGQMVKAKYWETDTDDYYDYGVIVQGNDLPENIHGVPNLRQYVSYYRKADVGSKLIISH